MNAPTDRGLSSGNKKLNGLFIGPTGLRPVFGIGLFVILLAAFIFAGMALFPSLKDVPVDAHPGFAACRHGVMLGGALLATSILAVLEKRDIFSYGLRHRAGMKSALALSAMGAFWGFAAISTLIGLLALAGHIAFDGVSLHGVDVMTFACGWAGAFFVIALAEEMVFRGYLLSTLARGVGFWPAALALSFGFGAYHLLNEGEDALGTLVAALGGITFALAVRRSGSLWWGIGFHTAWDWAQSYFYGTRDSGFPVGGHLFSSHPIGDVRWSGGNVGPEGSVLVLPVFALSLIIISLTLKRDKGRS